MNSHSEKGLMVFKKAPEREEKLERRKTINDIRQLGKNQKKDKKELRSLSEGNADQLEENPSWGYNTLKRRQISDKILNKLKTTKSPKKEVEGECN